MWSTVAMVTMLTLGAPSKGRVDEAMTHLAKCKSVTANICLNAAAIVGNAGHRALPQLGKALPRMTRPGQILGISVLAGAEGRHGTKVLESVARKRALPAVIRSIAIANLGMRKGKTVERTLVGLLKVKDHVVRAAAARALGTRSHYNAPTILKALRRATRDRNPEVRVEALLGLGLSGAAMGGEALAEGLEDAVPKVQYAAAEGLLFVKSDDAVHPLIESLRSEDRELSLRASKALRFQTGLNYGRDYEVWTEWYRHWQR